MRSPADHIDERALREALTASWELDALALTYMPVGGGAYHWTIDCADASRRFLTCDDLDNKHWIGLGRDRNAVFEGLTGAYGTALSLRESGHRFVVAPIPTTTGLPTFRLDDRHTLSVFEYVDGRQWQWGERLPKPQDQALLDTLVDLHQATPTAAGLHRRQLDVPGRDDVDDALRHLDGPWNGGPLSEDTRQVLADGAENVRALFDELDSLVRTLEDDDRPPVITHGEPHPGNVIYADDQAALIDWDTVAVAPPERDLWMLAEIDRSLLTSYQDRTGVVVNPDGLRAWRLIWGLTDLAAFTTLLRGTHTAQTDTRRSLVGLRQIIAGTEPRPYG